MLKSERENEIVMLLNDCHYTTVDHLAKQLHISPSSVRRDLTNLESRGLVKRSYGGVELANSVNKLVPFSLRSHENIQEKKKIAKMAASLVKDGDVLYLDGSSSTYYMIDYIASLKNITVVTNSIDSVNYLSQYDIKSFCTGGNISRENNAVLIGSYAEYVIQNIHADYAFFSAQAVWTNGNIYDCYESEVPIRRLMLQNAAKKVFLSDKSKFNNTSVFYLENLRNMDYVVTDIQLKKDFTKQFQTAKFLIAE